MKDFNNWHKLKAELDNSAKIPMFKEREIWWCSIGMNIGYEQDGKNDLYNRPVLIVKKFNKRIFWGIPLTSKIKHNNPHYHNFEFQGKNQAAILLQMRLLDAIRLSGRMGRLTTKTHKDITGKVTSCLN